MKKKMYIAYAITHRNYGCGCPYFTHTNARNSSGELYFDDYEKAVIAAKKQMEITNADDWNVV